MKKYKMFNKGISKKDKLDFNDCSIQKWNKSEQSSNESSLDVQTFKKDEDSPSLTKTNNTQNSLQPVFPQTASNGQYYDHYNITQGELSDKMEKSNSSGNLSWPQSIDQNVKSEDKPQLINETGEHIDPRVSSGSHASSDTDSNSNESLQNSSSAESSIMKVALGEIGSISKYVSEGSVNIPDMLNIPVPPTPSPPPPPAAATEEESNVSVPPAEEEVDDSYVEMQPELTITNAFSLSVEMWENSQDEKPEDDKDKVVASETENKNSGSQNSKEELANNGIDHSQEEKSQTADSESFDLSKVKDEVVEGPFSCSHCGTVTADATALQEHIATHPPKKPKVYLHQCSVADCGFSTNVIREFISHYQVNHEGLSSYVCRWCKAQINTLSVFIEHVKENFVVPWVKCPHCHLKKKNKSEVVEHISVEHPGESQRVIAGSMFLCRNSSHSREKEAKVFTESHKTLVSLLNNQKYILNNSNHNANESIVEILSPGHSGQGYQCTECSFSTTNAQVFLAHIKVCESMKSATKQRNVNFECKECSFATSSREAFLNHSHVKASLMNGMKRAPYKKRPIEARNELIRKKVLSIKKQTLALKLKKDKEAMDLGVSKSGEKGPAGHFKFSCPYCSEKFQKLNRMKFHIFLSHRDSYSQTFPLHQCLSCHMKSSSEEIVRQHIERTHFGRKSGILLINEPPEIIPRKFKTPNLNKKLVQSIAPIIKVDPAGSTSTDNIKKSNERCSSWGRSPNNEDSKQSVMAEVTNLQKTNLPVPDANKLTVSVSSTVEKETVQNNPKPEPTVTTEQTTIPESDLNVKIQSETYNVDGPPQKNLAMEIVKFTAGDHFTEYIQCPRCSYQSRSVMGFYGHIKRHLDLVVHINTRRKYEFHKPKAERSGAKAEGGNGVGDEAAMTDAAINNKIDEDSLKESSEPLLNENDTQDDSGIKEALSPMSPAAENAEHAEPESVNSMEVPRSSPPKLESIIINKKSENLIDKEEYSKLGGPILNAKLSSLYTSNGEVKVCKICNYMADFPCYIHRHLLSAHLNIHFWECGYCFYRHLQRYKVIRHCMRNHANREPYAKWLGIPDWEKRLSDCLKKIKPEKTESNDHNDSDEKLDLSSSSAVESSNNTSTLTVNKEDNDKIQLSETVTIEKLPGNLFKCGSCTMCSIQVSQVLRHIRYHHNAEGKLPDETPEVTTLPKNSTPSVQQEQKIETPPPPPSIPSEPTGPSSPVLKKSPPDQAGKKTGQVKSKCKKITPMSIPKTPYRCVFCNYVNMCATEVKKHMWREHSDELNNVGILLKSKEEGEKASHSVGGKGGSESSKKPPIKRKLKRTFRPHKRKKTKTYSKGVKESSKKKTVAKPTELGLNDTSPPKSTKKKPSTKSSVPMEIPLEVVSPSQDDSVRKRSAVDLNKESPVMPKKRQIQSTQHSDYEWESPSLAEPPNSKSERIYKSSDKSDEGFYRNSYFEKSSPEKELSIKSKWESLLVESSSQDNSATELKDGFDIGTSSLTMPVFRKAEMDIYKRFIFKTYDGIFLCNYCLVSMSDEIEARLHILQVHPKKPTNPLEQPCKTFQLFRKKTRRPEVIVPHAAQPRTNIKSPSKGVQKKGGGKKKNPGGKFVKNHKVSLTDLFENINKNRGSGFHRQLAGLFDGDSEKALIIPEEDVNCMFTWKWADPHNDNNKTTPQHCSDSEQISVLRLITYRQGETVAGHFKCPFCQLISTSHVRVSDHIRTDHMELTRFKCRECTFRSWFLALVDNHKKLQHVDSQSAESTEPLPLLSKDSELGIAFKTGSPGSMVQAPSAEQTYTNAQDCALEHLRPDVKVVTDYRTLYLRTFCQESKAVMYMCTICSQKLPNQKSYFEHVICHYGKVYQCTVCAHITCERDLMKTHLGQHRQFPKATVIVLQHEPILDREDHHNYDYDDNTKPHDQIVKPEANPSELPLPSPPTQMEDTKPQAVSSPSKTSSIPPPFPKPSTFCCVNCPSRFKSFNAFSLHLANHFKQTMLMSHSDSTFSNLRGNSTSRSSGLLSSFSDDLHGRDNYAPEMSSPQKHINFAVCVSVTDVFSFYSDNVFSYYS